MKKLGQLLCLVLVSGCGIPANNSDTTTLSPTRDLKQELGFLEHEQENTQVQMAMFEQKLEAQDNLISDLRGKLLESNQRAQRSSNEQISSLIKQLEALQQTVDIQDKTLQELRNHSQNLSSSLAQSFEKIKEFDRNMRKLQVAMESLIDIGERSTAATGAVGTREYMVRSGDTLEKIAKKHHVTIADLKRANGLTGDRIYAEQKLAIPIQ